MTVFRDKYEHVSADSTYLYETFVLSYLNCYSLNHPAYSYTHVYNHPAYSI